MSITSKFIKAFDPKNRAHVTWLGLMCDLAETLNDPSTHLNLVNEINKNPMNIRLEARDALDWAHIHFCLSAVYSKAVLRGHAFTPFPSA